MRKFKHLKNRIHAFILTLLTVVLVLVMVMVNQANMGNASEQVLHDIRANGNIFNSAIRESSQHLIVSARLLSSDYAFKKAYATYDRDTIISAMKNHLYRLESADLMLMMDIDDGVVIASTEKSIIAGADSPVDDLIIAAEEDDYLETVGFEMLNGSLYQFAVVPLMVPDPVAWIVIGFRIDNAYLQRFKELSSSDISVFVKNNKNGQVLATTLASDRAEELSSWLSESTADESASVMKMHGENFLTHVRHMSDDKEIGAVLQRSLDSAMRPYMKLQFSLAAVFVIALLVAFLGSSLLSKNIASPVLVLAGFARRIASGDYKGRTEVTTEDEIGELADAFNTMSQGLQEKEEVQNLLGKVVSPEIATQLMENGVELGGEEKEVTVLFSDLRNFTSLCEGRSAGEILSLLNLYLNEMSGAVEKNNGVVDKYIGDAMMALYGAPLHSVDDADNAVITALKMKDTLVEVNRDFLSRGLPEIDIGIGVNTDVVVAGNMGSSSRLNYTVIGDGVNLASRLEGLTKFYGLKVLVSQSTAEKTSSVSYREIDTVRVKGKTEPIVIYEPYRAEMDTGIVNSLDDYGDALTTYKEGGWDAATVLFERLVKQHPEQRLYKVYLERCHQLVATPPDSWDGVYTFTKK